MWCSLTSQFSQQCKTQSWINCQCTQDSNRKGDQNQNGEQAKEQPAKHSYVSEPLPTTKAQTLLHTALQAASVGAEVPGAAREAGSQGTGRKRAGLWALLSDLLTLFPGQAGFSTCLARLFFWQVWVQVSWESQQAEPRFSMWVSHRGLISGQVPHFKKFLCLL